MDPSGECKLRPSDGSHLSRFRFIFSFLRRHIEGVYSLISRGALDRNPTVLSRSQGCMNAEPVKQRPDLVVRPLLPTVYKNQQQAKHGYKALGGHLCEYPRWSREYTLCVVCLAINAHLRSGHSATSRPSSAHWVPTRSRQLPFAKAANDLLPGSEVGMRGLVYMIPGTCTPQGPGTTGAQYTSRST